MIRRRPHAAIHLNRSIAPARTVDLEWQIMDDLPLHPPRGSYQASIDTKGRLKLPQVFCQYLAQFGSDCFVTSMDGQTARIYTQSSWREVEKMFTEHREDEAVEDLVMLITYYGSDTEIDASGRMLMSDMVRMQMKLDGATVWLTAKGDAYIEVIPDSLYQERMAKARSPLGEDFPDLAGLC